MKAFKNFKIIIVLLLINSCSKSDDSGTIDSDVDTFLYEYENQDISITSWQAQRSENTFAVSGFGNDGESIFILFNKYGNLEDVIIFTGKDDEDGFSESYSSFKYFRSNYFDFELIKFDETSKRVSVTFSGNLYEDSYDIESATRFIEGSFNVPYNEVTPQIAGLGVSAKIDNLDWYSTNSSTSSSGTTLAVNRYSDDAYVISYVIIPNDDTNIGLHQFNESSTVNKITFSKYDINSNQFIEYETTGSFKVDEHNIGFGITVIEGTFNLVATNGDDIIQVNNGIIKDVYSF